MVKPELFLWTIYTHLFQDIFSNDVQVWQNWQKCTNACFKVFFTLKIYQIHQTVIHSRSEPTSLKAPGWMPWGWWWEASSSLMQPRLRGGTDEHKQIKDRNDLEPNAHSATLSRHRALDTPPRVKQGRGWGWAHCRVGRVGCSMGSRKEREQVQMKMTNKDTGKREAKVPSGGGAAKGKHGTVQAL